MENRQSFAGSLGLHFSLLTAVVFFALIPHAHAAGNASSGVLGKLDKNPTTSASGDAPTASVLYYPEDTLADSANHRIFVADTGNNRVLVFNVNPTTGIPSKEASYVFGQTNFSSANSGISQSEFENPTGLAYDPASERLFVTDYSNNRVLVFDASTGTLNKIPFGENAEYVFGQSSFTIGGNGEATQNTIGQPSDIAYDSVSQRLFVADYENARVLVFNASKSVLAKAPLGENAEDVIGQPNFTANDNWITQSGLGRPTGVAYDQTTARLFVADSGDNRVLVFDASTASLKATPVGESAEDVIGQPNFTSSNYVVTQNGFYDPQYLNYDPVSGRLFVSDNGNNRVMIFNATVSALSANPAGENAENVLGQPNFTQDITHGNGTTTRSGLYYPRGLGYDSNSSYLFVSDSANNRVMVFNVSPAVIKDGENAVYEMGQTNARGGLSYKRNYVNGQP